MPKNGGVNGNAIGITTTFYHGYTPDIDEFKALMDKEFEPIEIWVKAGGSVVIPCEDKGNHNLGTGIADLKNKVPGGIEYIQSKIDNLVKSGQQATRNPQNKSLDALKQELHDALSKERQCFQFCGGLGSYLSFNQPSVQQQIQQKGVKTGSESEEPSAKKVKLWKLWELQTRTQGVKRPEDDIPRIDPKRQKVSEMYAASGVKSALHGTVYQLKLLMLFLKRGINEGYSFRLATEMDAAEKFDDVVFQYDENNKKVYRYLQAKHKQFEDKTIGVGDLLTREKNGEFRLAKYFVSYLKIKNNQYFGDSTLGDFTICTNIGFDLDQDTRQSIVKKLKVQTTGANKGKEIFVELVIGNDVFFKDGGDRYKFSYDNNNMISEMKLVFKDVLAGEMKELTEKMKKLEERIKKLKDKSIKDKVLEQTQKELETSQNWQKAFKQIIKDGLEDSIKEFFDKLIFAVNQPNEVELAEIITKDLGEEFNSIDSRNVYARFQEEMLNWMKEKEGHFLTDEDEKEFFIKMKEEILGGFRFDVRSPIASFTGREKELEELSNLMQTSQAVPAVISQLTSISGLGGVGKTELARKYIKEYSIDYDNNIIWINAETYATMEQSFLGLARDLLGIPTKDRSIESIVRDAYAFFARRKSLFIFDNAEKLRSEGQNTGISQFLPTYFSLSPGSNKPNVLITSRNQEWGEIKVLPLDIWTEEEAIEFVKKSLGKEQEEDIKRLVKELQYFPLALQQAVAYTKEEDKIFRNVRREFKISDYLEPVLKGFKQPI